MSRPLRGFGCFERGIPATGDAINRARLRIIPSDL